MLNSEFWSQLSFAKFFTLITLANVLMYSSTGSIVFLLRKYFIQFNLNFQNQFTTRKEVIQSFQVVFANVLVGLIGFALLKVNLITLTNKTGLFAVLDFFTIFFFIDFGIFLSSMNSIKPFTKHFFINGSIKITTPMKACLY